MTERTWRRHQALETRRQIVRAARRLFVTLGYVGTTVEAIAAEAGVAVATVYKAFGTKAAIARELNDLIDEEAGVAAHSERIALASQPTELIGAAVALNVNLHNHCGDIIQATRAGAAVDTTLAEVYAEGTRRHDSGIRMVIDKLHAAGVLRADLELRQAGRAVLHTVLVRSVCRIDDPTRLDRGPVRDMDRGCAMPGCC